MMLAPQLGESGPLTRDRAAAWVACGPEVDRVGRPDREPGFAAGGRSES